MASTARVWESAVMFAAVLVLVASLAGGTANEADHVGVGAGIGAAVGAGAGMVAAVLITTARGDSSDAVQDLATLAMASSTPVVGAGVGALIGALVAGGSPEEVSTAALYASILAVVGFFGLVTPLGYGFGLGFVVVASGGGDVDAAAGNVLTAFGVVLGVCVAGISAIGAAGGATEARHNEERRARSRTPLPATTPTTTAPTTAPATPTTPAPTLDPASDPPAPLESPPLESAPLDPPAPLTAPGPEPTPIDV